MSRIKDNLTGDVFEAPARDFANEADFTIVDPSTPITAVAPEVPASAAGELDTSASAPVEPAPSGSTGMQTDTQSSVLQSTQTDPTISTTPTSMSTSTQVGTAPSVQGDPGNVSPIVTDSPTTLTTEPPPVATSAIDTTAATADASSSQSTMSTSSPGTDLPNDGAATSPAATATPADASPVSDAGNAQGAATPSDASAGGSPVSDAASSDAASRVTTADSAAILDVKSKHIVADQLESDTLFAIANLAAVTDNLKHAADAFFTAVHSQIDAEAAS